jgi:DNA mismatch repair protein MutL
MHIEKLPNEVIDQIAAGEVVERPAHLVKELVENSLDAGATEISVEFSLGGRFVKITDNGSGIQSSQIEKALDRHATSKIKLSEDLWKLSSFGFRGEALASIAAVSRLTLISKSKNEKLAARIVCEFGKKSPVEQIAGALGTVVIMDNLFENVPARLKFLKSAAAEYSRIKMAVKALALSHPGCAFRMVQDGELVAQYLACENKVDRAAQIFNVKNLMEGRAVRGGVKAHAIFADPKTVQKTSKDLWFFAQDRWIQDRGLQAAVMEAYRHLLMHGEYPMVAVWVETNPEDIDVNIHPTKSQVKFADQSLAFRAVQAAVRDTLETAPWIPKTVPQTQMMPEIFSESFSSPEFVRTQFAVKEVLREPSVVYQAQPQVQNLQNSDSVSFSNAYWSSLQVLAQANLTYIVTQGPEGLVFVDQHAAHERVMFEKLMSAWRGGKIEVQEFLFPFAIDLSAEKVEALIKETEAIGKLGISVEALGPETIGVKAAPLVLRESAISHVLEKMSAELVEQGGSHRLERKIGDLVSTMACHSAIRAGQALSLEEMKALLVSMDEFPQSGFCPHGRPVSVEYPFHVLEKDFGRIV